MTTPRKRTPRDGTHQAAQVSKLLDRTDVQTTDHATPAQSATQPTRDEHAELMQLIWLLSDRNRAIVAALMAALIDSQTGTLAKRDDKSLRAAVSRAQRAGNTRPIAHWLRAHYYLTPADSQYSQKARSTMAAHERAQGGHDGE